MWYQEWRQVTDARRPAAVFGTPARIIIALCAITFVFVKHAIVPVLLANPPVDELTWVDRALMPEWTPAVTSKGARLEAVESYRSQYYYACQHPTVVRLLYRTVLHASGVTEAPETQYDYSLGYEENIARGNYLPAYIRLPLRLTNAVLVYAAVMLIYFGLLKISRRPILTAVAVVPIVAEPLLVNAFNNVISYIGTDAALFFMMALFWFAWLSVDAASISGAFLLGIIGGLTAATKYNGAIVLVAAMVYVAFAARGWRRTLWPSVMAAVAVAVFVLVNPIYTADGPRWAVEVLKDTIGFLTNMQADAAASGDYISGRGELLTLLFPFLPFTLPSLALLVERRRQWWFPRTFVWTAAIVLGNLAVIMVFLPTYAAPIRIAFEVLILAGGLCCVSVTRHDACCSRDDSESGKKEIASSREVVADAEIANGEWLARERYGLIAVGVAVVLSFLIRETPTGVLSAALMLVLACGVWLILRSAFWTASVLAPLFFTLPWRPCPVLYDMMSFTLACGILWVAFVATRRPEMKKHRLNALTAAAAVAFVISWWSLIVLVPAALICVVSASGRERCRLACALLGPPIAILLVQWAVTGKLRIVTQWNDLLAPPKGLWSLSTLSEYVHGKRYNRMIFKFGQGMYWAPAIAFALWSLRARRQWWFAATFGGAAIAVAGALLFGEPLYFQWSMPLQVALLVPFGIVAVDTLRSLRGRTARTHPTPENPSTSNVSIIVP